MSNWEWFLIQIKHWKHDWGDSYVNPFEPNEHIRDCKYLYCSKKRRYTHVKGYWWTTDV